MGSAEPRRVRVEATLEYLAFEILANPDLTDIEIVLASATTAQMDRCVGRSLRIIGTFALINGALKTMLVIPLDDKQIEALSSAVICYLMALIESEVFADSFLAAFPTPSARVN